MRSDRPAPATLHEQLAGAVLFALCMGISGCDRGSTAGAVEEGPRVLELDSASIQLPDSIRLAVIALDRSIPADMNRTSVELRVGDIVRFEAKDAGGHAIAFDGVALPEPARAWLEAAGQLRSPPLISAGNAWVVTFQNAPPGEYPFQCLTHGARGTLRVRSR